MCPCTELSSLEHSFSTAHNGTVTPCIIEHVDGSFNWNDISLNDNIVYLNFYYKIYSTETNTLANMVL